jgi:pimeloyl-ACP methyl ester carboxylesterase
MPYVKNNGTRIHYEVQGEGPPLVLQHGTTGSWEDWEEFGYAQPLRQDYRLILIDARGHGASDKPHDAAAYDHALRASDVTAVLHELGVQKAHFFGYSLGGWIGFGLARYAPDRIASMILGGAHPFEENMQPFRDAMPRDMDAFMASMERVYDGHLTPALRDRLRKNDLEALSVLTQDRLSLAAMLPTMTMPCLLFVGEADPRLSRVQECVSNLGNATFVSLPGRDHVGTFVASDLVLPHVKAFLTKAPQL